MLRFRHLVRQMVAAITGGVFLGVYVDSSAYAQAKTGTENAAIYGRLVFSEHLNFSPNNNNLHFQDDK